MRTTFKLSELVGEIRETIEDRFEGEVYTISAQITNVKKYETNRRCYLTLEEYENGAKTAEVKAVFWSNTYAEIEKFEKVTGQIFRNGIEIICKVKVRFHSVYGLNFDVLNIDVAHTLGSLELERQKTLERLLKENPSTIQLFDGIYRTFNKRLQLPPVIKNIALITAPNSDGQRDFLQELKHNKHGYTFQVREFLTTIQGEQAHQMILEQLQKVAQDKTPLDAVAIIRGGGSQTDFKPFDDYELARTVAGFPIPVLTGIGHDRNQSIIDLMAREQKTPTKVAALIVDHNFEFENTLMALRDRFADLVERRLQQARDRLDYARRMVRLASPQTILDRGFAIVTINDQIMTDPTLIKEHSEIATRLRDQIIYSTVNKKIKHEKNS